MPLPPRESFRVVSRSSQPGRLEMVSAEGSVAVYGWPGSTLKGDNAETLVNDFTSVFPELSHGMFPQGA